MIFTVFISCRNYKDCECEFHKAVFDWLVPSSQMMSIFQKQDLLEKIRLNPKYTDWENEWQRVILP